MTFNFFPLEIQSQILSETSLQDLSACNQVCKTWNFILSRDLYHIWDRIFQKTQGYQTNYPATRQDCLFRDRLVKNLGETKFRKTSKLNIFKKLHRFDSDYSYHLPNLQLFGFDVLFLWSEIKKDFNLSGAKPSKEDSALKKPDLVMTIFNKSTQALCKIERIPRELEPDSFSKKKRPLKGTFYLKQFPRHDFDASIKPRKQLKFRLQTDDFEVVLSKTDEVNFQVTFVQSQKKKIKRVSDYDPFVIYQHGLEKVALWDTENNRRIAKITLPKGERVMSNCAYYNQKMIIPTTSGKIFIYQIENLKKDSKIEVPRHVFVVGDKIQDFFVLDDKIVLEEPEGNLRVFCLIRYKEIINFDGDNHKSRMLIAKKENILAIPHEDKLRIWNLRDNTLQGEIDLAPYQKAGISLELVLKHQRAIILAKEGLKNTTEIWDLSENRISKLACIETHSQPAQPSVLNFFWDISKQILVLYHQLLSQNSKTTDIHFIDLQTGNKLETIEGLKGMHFKFKQGKLTFFTEKKRGFLHTLFVDNTIEYPANIKVKMHTLDF